MHCLVGVAKEGGGQRGYAPIGRFFIAPGRQKPKFINVVSSPLLEILATPQHRLS